MKKTNYGDVPSFVRDNKEYFEEYGAVAFVNKFNDVVELQCYTTMLESLMLLNYSKMSNFNVIGYSKLGSSQNMKIYIIEIMEKENAKEE